MRVPEEAPRADRDDGDDGHGHVHGQQEDRIRQCLRRVSNIIQQCTRTSSKNNITKCGTKPGV